ncbi:MAG: tryptophan-rich sensory protein [Firmicutes bacterium]|nr:tryptophan-rich sensory protein [Bacillota bacterium]
MKKAKIFSISILIPLLVGGLSALLTYKKTMVYSELNQPPLSPPMPVFGIVWTILFILMGISCGMVYLKRAETDVSAALKVYGFQLVLNFFWTIIFFNMGAYLFAFIWLLLILVFVAVMIAQFYKISRAAAYLQIPYLLWLIFAGYLNIMIFILN